MKDKQNIPSWVAWLAEKLNVTVEGLMAGPTLRQEQHFGLFDVVTKFNLFELIKGAVELATKEMAAAIQSLEADVKGAQAIAQEHYRCRMEAEAKLGKQESISKKIDAVFAAAGYKLTYAPFGTIWRKEMRISVDGCEPVRVAHEIHASHITIFRNGVEWLISTIKEGERAMLRQLVDKAVQQRTVTLNARIEMEQKAYERVHGELLSLKERIREVAR